MIITFRFFNRVRQMMELGDHTKQNDFEDLYPSAMINFTSSASSECYTQDDWTSLRYPKDNDLAQSVLTDEKISQFLSFMTRKKTEQKQKSPKDEKQKAETTKQMSPPVRFVRANQSASAGQP
jgi:hypothetical protein